MQYALAPYGGREEPFASWDGAFSADELDRLEAIAAGSQISPTVGDANGNRADDEIRRSKVSWLYAADHGWVFQRLGDIATLLNARHWGLDLTGFGEALQATRYADSEAGHYDWHQDFGAVVSRKLSVVVQLTDPDAYQGGDLEIMVSGQPMPVPRLRGRIACFPSYQLHRVTPVTKGVRHSLVAWISGPRFR